MELAGRRGGSHLGVTLPLAEYRGELAALATAGCWTVSALAFAAAANRVGSLALNLVRLAMACCFFIPFGWLVRGLPFPSDATSHNWFWLSLSGLVGFTLGDLCLFRAFILIGPRLTMLLMTLVPMIAAFLGWAALGEGMAASGLAGMALTVGGVAWVVMERRPPGLNQGKGTSLSAAGLLLGLGAATGQAVGLVLSKIGMAGYDPFASTQVRTAAGLAGFVVLFFILRAWPRVAAAVRNRPGMGYAALGAGFGPFVGVSLSLMAVQYTRVGVAATIMSIVPVLIIPFVVLLHRERVSPRAVFGAVLAVAGVALLFLGPEMWRALLTGR